MKSRLNFFFHFLFLFLFFFLFQFFFFFFFLRKGKCLLELKGWTLFFNDVGWSWTTLCSQALHLGTCDCMLTT